MDVHECIFAVTCYIKGMKFSDVMDVNDKNRCGCPRTACESTESVDQVFKGDQKLSVRNASGRLNMPTTTVHIILCSFLKKKPY
jgi:hypothetical protein